MAKTQLATPLFPTCYLLPIKGSLRFNVRAASVTLAKAKLSRVLSSMPYRFTDPASYPYKPGSLFLGLDPATGAEVGIQTERNAITIAGAGGGKGTCLIIPNLLRWPHGALVIDPKGENAEETAKQRREMGQRVGVLDPFGASKVPKRFRVSINPLALSRKPDVRPSRDDIFAIADGIVKRTDPKAAAWDDGARTIIAGVIAFVVEMATPDMRTLAEARRVLMQPEILPADDQGRDCGLRADAKDMTALGGMAAAAGVSILSALDKGKGADSEYLSLARQHSQWLDSPEIDAALSSTSFQLSDLAKGKGTLFLVLPYGKMDQYSAFLRMVVRVAQNTIAEAGNKRAADQRCLFILDEFFTLGRIDEIQKAAGNMRSYGLQLWPFLQDFGQLTQLYGDDGSETFFSNADAQIYFANTDTKTLSRVSDQLEKVKPHEVVTEPPPVIAFETKPFRPWRDSKWWESEKQARARFEAAQQSARDDLKAANDRARGDYDHRAKEAGTARLTANEVAARVGRGNEDKVARSAIVFAKMGDVLNVKLAPFFDKKSTALVPSQGMKPVQVYTTAQKLADLKEYEKDDKYGDIGYLVIGAILDRFVSDRAKHWINHHDRLAPTIFFSPFIIIPILFWGFTINAAACAVIAIICFYMGIGGITYAIGLGVVQFYRIKLFLEQRFDNG